MHKKVVGSIVGWCLSFLITGTLVLWMTPAKAEVPQAGQVYLGGTKMEYPDGGVSFTLPDNTIAMASKDTPLHELSVGIVSLIDKDNNTMIIQIGTADYESLAKEMNQTVTYKGIDLIPDGKATREQGHIVYNTFHYIDDGENRKSFMVGMVAQDNIAIILTTFSPPEMFEAYQQAVAAIGNTVTVTTAAPGAAPANPQNLPQAGMPSGGHANDLVGAWMSRKNHGSGGIYIESASKWVFSANGTVAWGSGAVIAGGTAGVSLRGGGDNPPDYGAWATNGARLNINWADGTNGQWTYEVFNDYNGDPTLALTTRAGDKYFYRKID